MTSIRLKSKVEIEIMRRANMIVYRVLQALTQMVSPGITTLDLNAKALEMTREFGATPVFLGYPGPSKDVAPFPGVICASVNDAIVHGLPNDRPLEEGDIVSIDYGCVHEGFCGDSAVTVPVGQISTQAVSLLQVTEQSLQDAILQCYPGQRIGDVSYAVQQRVEKNGFSIIREFVGHGIGKEMHEAPPIPNYGRPHQGRVLKPGLVLAIEPMVAIGSYEVKTLEDGWTAVTRDGSLSAHFEHTVAVTENGPYVLSRP